MRLKNVPGSREQIAASEICIKNPENYKGNWNHRLFQNEQPLHIEIGMGKGRFLIACAKENPDINYLGIEMYSSVLCRAVETMDAFSPEEKPENLRFLSFDATNITDIFAQDEVDRIYLNFSDPWPKERHAKRRLTSPRFLERYAKFLKKEGELHFKTDNNALFDFSLETLTENNWEILAQTRDLHNDSVLNQNNLMTEYEIRFSRQGIRINKLIARQTA